METSKPTYSMFSIVSELRTILSTLLDSIKYTDNKKFTANQALKIEDINIGDNSSITINMHNTISSVEAISRALEIVNELSSLVPVDGGNLASCINSYEKLMISNACKYHEGKYKDISKDLGITYRQTRYLIEKHNIRKEC